MHTLKWKRVLVFTKLKKFCNKPQKVLIPKDEQMNIVLLCHVDQGKIVHLYFYLKIFWFRLEVCRYIVKLRVHILWEHFFKFPMKYRSCNCCKNGKENLVTSISFSFFFLPFLFTKYFFENILFPLLLCNCLFSTDHKSNP